MIRLPKSFLKSAYKFCSSQQYFTEKVGRIKSTKLENGVTVVTESETFPHSVDLGVLIDVGTRDEVNFQLRGISIQAFQKHQSPDGVKNLETLHYLGSNLSFEYDQESMMFKASCLHKDLDAILDITMNCALQQRSHIFDYQEHNLIQNENEFYTFDDQILMQAFGQHSVGLPLNGLQENYNQMNASKMTKFYNENICLSKLYIYGGAENHEEFCSLVLDKMNKFNLPRELSVRDQSHYKGGLKLVDNDSEELGIFFPGSQWSIESLIMYNVIEKIMGSTASFSTGGPGKGMHSRTSQQMLNRYFYFHSADCYIKHFQDNGLFGLKVTGPYNQQQNMIKTVAQKLKELKQPIDQIELNRAKNIFKSHVFQVLERKQCRLEEATKNLKMLGNVYWPEYESYVDKITTEQINSKMNSIFNQEPTLVVQGRDANTNDNGVNIVKQIMN